MTRQRKWLRCLPVLGDCLPPAGPNARGEPRRQPERGTSGGCGRRLQCVVRGRLGTTHRPQGALPSAWPGPGHRLAGWTLGIPHPGRRTRDAPFPGVTGVVDRTPGQDDRTTAPAGPCSPRPPLRRAPAPARRPCATPATRQVRGAWRHQPGRPACVPVRRRPMGGRCRAALPLPPRPAQAGGPLPSPSPAATVPQTPRVAGRRRWKRPYGAQREGGMHQPPGTATAWHRDTPGRPAVPSVRVSETWRLVSTTRCPGGGLRVVSRRLALASGAYRGGLRSTAAPRVPARLATPSHTRRVLAGPGDASTWRYSPLPSWVFPRAPAPNASLQLLPEAGATQERRL
jgi:hypothetical protein